MALGMEREGLDSTVARASYIDTLNNYSSSKAVAELDLDTTQEYLDAMLKINER